MEHVTAFLKEEDGVGVVEIILILVVLISLVLIFKKQLTSLVKSILSKAVSQSNNVCWTLKISADRSRSDCVHEMS